MSNDIAVIPAGLPIGAPVNKKPIYLIIAEAVDGKTKNKEKFIAIDKPELLNGFVMVKGFFCDESEEDVSKNLSDLLTNTKKELYVEMYFPWHRIRSIKSLVFRAK
jgi:hypothetical protein